MKCPPIINGGPLTTISDVQGSLERSPFEEARVTVRGVVTVASTHGFYLQDPDAPLSNDTSRAIYVYTGPDAVIPEKGDNVEVTGDVTEWRSERDAQSAALTLTQLAGRNVIISQRPKMRSVPEPVKIGVNPGDIHPPTESASQGIAFWKQKLEGQLVTIDAPAVVGATHRGEFYIVPSGGRGATGMTTSGALFQAEGDANPEAIAVSGKHIEGVPSLAVGDSIPGRLTGVITYKNGRPVLELTEPFEAKRNEIPEFDSPYRGTETKMVKASMNVENLDPGDNEKYEILARKIIGGYHNPDLLSLQEVQDNDGANNSNETDASLTMKKLIDKIAELGGPRYEYADIPPEDDQDGGQPGGNIRVGFLYRKDRIALADGEKSLKRLCKNHPAFNDSRKSLAGEFVFLPTGVKFTEVNSHLSSKRGGTSSFGEIQPPRVGGAAQRLAQAKVVHAYLAALRKTNPNSRVYSVGDFNQREFEHPTVALSNGSMVNLMNRLPEGERCTYIFQGNSGAIDQCEVPLHMLNSVKLVVDDTNPRLPDGDPRKASDHGVLLTESEMTASAKDDVVEADRLAALREEAQQWA